MEELFLAHCPILTDRRFYSAVKIFGTANAFWQASVSDIQALPWKQEIIDRYITWRKAFNAEQALRILEQEDIQWIGQDNEAYPPLLKEIYDPPRGLFVRGKLDQSALYLAVVGARKYTTYGKHVTESLLPSLVQSGLTIVSGLAIGIDSIAHQSTLESSGKTIAVLPGGINSKSIYPRMHCRLAEDIIDGGGALISEYPPATEVNKYSFPRRNRIIAGMSLGTFVIEASLKSGSLITAQSALEQNREVFAVPHPITATTGKGTNQLLQNGAHLVQSAEDILQVLSIEQQQQIAQNKRILPESKEEEIILAILNQEAMHVDDLIRKSQLASHVVTSTLTMMLMKGMIKELRKMEYIRC